MSVENPTPEAGGASITEQLEAMLGGNQTEGGQEAAPQPEAEAPANDATDGEESQIPLSDLAKLFGVEEDVLDVDDDGTLKVKTKIDGQEGAAKFRDLVKSYQLQGSVDAKARQAAEQAQQIQAERAQFESYAAQEVQKLTQAANIAHQVLMADAAKVDWDALAQNDPVEYVAKKHAFDARAQQVQQLMGYAQQQHGQFQQAMQARARQALMAEAQRLSSVIPEWSDSAKMESERSAMVSWLKSKGVSDYAIGNITDAGMVAALRVAMLSEKTNAKAPEVEKKVRAAPKLVKSGVSVSKSEKDGESLRGLMDTVKKSGGKSGVADWLIAAGKV